jgi:hypothetical protein
MSSMDNPSPEYVGALIYAKAGLDPRELRECVAVDLAVRLHGGDCIRLQPHAFQEATHAVVDGCAQIVLRDGLTAQRTNFALARITARLAVRESTWWLAMSGVERLNIENSVAAWLLAPSPVFRSEVARVGADIQELANIFVITETATSLRLAETGGPDTAVTTPITIHMRGPSFRNFAAEHIRALATARSLRHVRRVVLIDEPGRVALFSRTG